MKSSVCFFRPHGFLVVCRCLENKAAQPDFKANVVARGECREEGRGDDVGREDGERDERDPSCEAQRRRLRSAWAVGVSGERTHVGVEVVTLVLIFSNPPVWMLRLRRKPPTVGVSRFGIYTFMNICMVRVVI